MIHRENFVTRASTKSIYDNPIGEYITDPDYLIIDENLVIDVDTKRIYVSGAITAQALYSKIKWHWRLEEQLRKYPFPLVAITPEQFEEIDGWSVNHYDVLFGGFSKMDTSGRTLAQYASIILVSGRGRIFVDKVSIGTAIPNAGLVKLTDGQPKGYFYQESETSEVIPLGKHMAKCVGVSLLCGMCYRIP